VTSLFTVERSLELSTQKVSTGIDHGIRNSAASGD